TGSRLDCPGFGKRRRNFPMEETLQEILENASTEGKAVETRAQCEAFKARFVGRSGALTGVMKGMGKIPPEQKPVVGKRINEVKRELERLFAETLQNIEEREILSRLGPPIDVSLPSPDEGPGSLHPLTKVREE